MNKRILLLPAVIAFIALVVLSDCVRAEEGMWTFDNLPLKGLKTVYSFEPSREWTDHVRLSSIKFKNGSGAFISSNGLAITNQHVVRGELQKISTPEKDYVKNGFYASSMDQEINCPDMELLVLVGFHEVTERLLEVSQNLGPREAAAARKKEIASMEKEHFEKTGNKAEIVTLYHGGEYWLYSYRIYKDVRLVFAPENQAAHFGGSFDNFTYPRYALDFSIFRVYDRGKPAVIKDFFPVNPGGVKDDELVFTIGHPGTTSRQLTVSQVLFLRDVYYPAALEHTRRAIKVLEEYSRKGAEQRRQAFAQTSSLENSLKRAEGEYPGITSELTINNFRKQEKTLRDDLGRKPELLKATGDPWGAIAGITAKYQERFKPVYYLFKENRMLSQALQLVMLAEETEKPDSERLAAYRSSKLEGLKNELLSKAPVYRDMEEVQLADYLAEVREYVGKEHPYVALLLANQTPESRARELIKGTTLDKAEARKELFEGGLDGIRRSQDALIVLARQLAPLRREMIQWGEDNYTEPLARQHELIANARFALYGKSVYPDGTSTLRMAYGTVKGFPYNGTLSPPVTTFFGMYDRYYSFFDKEGEWSLPPRLIEKQGALRLSTQLNFANTSDTTGGNSGSPVINRKGEIVGLNFDSNLEGQLGRYMYHYETKRAIAVSMAAIVEVLRSAYGAGKLADELTGEGKRK